VWLPVLVWVVEQAIVHAIAVGQAHARERVACTTTWYVPACAEAMLQVSALVAPSDLQSLLVAVGWLPNSAHQVGVGLPLWSGRALFQKT